MSLTQNNVQFDRTNYRIITKHSSNAGKTTLGKVGGKPKPDFTKLKEIFEILPGLNASIDSRSSSSSMSPHGMDDSSVNSDSGFGGSDASVKGEKKRWLKLDDALLHTDLKQFIQKYGIGFKSGLEEGTRKNVRTGVDYKKFFDQITARDDVNVAEITRKLENLIVDPKMADAAIVLKKHLELLCDVISHYHADKEFVEREVFQLAGSSDACDLDLKAQIGLAIPQDVFVMISEILDHLWIKMNVNAVEKFIAEMTMYCEQQGIASEVFEIGLKESILCFRVCAIDYINCASVENFNNFTKVIRFLASSINSVSTRLWILSSLIKAD